MIARLIHFQDVADEVRQFTFEAPEKERLEFTPGQFVSIVSVIEDKKITRAYSIASAPHSNRFDICLNLVQDGKLSPRLFELAPGDTVEFQGPLGYFTLRSPASDSVMIATGTGITPFRSILQSQLNAYPQTRFTLIFGVRYERNILYRSEFEALEAAHPNFRFWPTLSRPEPNWTGRTGHVQAHLTEALAGRTDFDVYICGLKVMVDDVRARLKELNFDRKRIIFEKYD